MRQAIIDRFTGHAPDRALGRWITENMVSCKNNMMYFKGGVYFPREMLYAVCNSYSSEEMAEMLADIQYDILLGEYFRENHVPYRSTGLKVEYTLRNHSSWVETQ